MGPSSGRGPLRGKPEHPRTRKTGPCRTRLDENPLSTDSQARRAARVRIAVNRKSRNGHSGGATWCHGEQDGGGRGNRGGQSWGSRACSRWPARHLARPRATTRPPSCPRARTSARRSELCERSSRRQVLARGHIPARFTCPEHQPNLWRWDVGQHEMDVKLIAIDRTSAVLVREPATPLSRGRSSCPSAAGRRRMPAPRSEVTPSGPESAGPGQVIR
jgi:hypothetical protein